MSAPDLTRTPAPGRARWRPDRDLVLSLAAVVVSACALAVSLVQTTVMRAQQYASVWPRLTTDLSVDLAADSLGRDSLTLTVRNAGVGPAQVAWAQLTFDGALIDDWRALIGRAAPPAGPGTVRASIIYNSLTGDVLIPGERHVALRLAGRPARWVGDAAGRVGLRICYCSVFDRCWRLENPSVGARIPREQVTPVPGCPRPAAPLV